MKYSTYLVTLALTLTVSSLANEQIQRRDIITDVTEKETKPAPTPTEKDNESTTRKPKETGSESSSKKASASASGSSQKESSKGKSESTKESSTSSKPKSTGENTAPQIKNLNNDSGAFDLTPKFSLAIGLAAIVAFL